MINDFATVFVVEFIRRVTSRPFIISIVIGMLAVSLFSFMPLLVSQAFSGPSNIALVGDPHLLARAKPLLAHDYTIQAELPPQTITAASLKAHHVSSAFVLTATNGRLALAIYAHDPSSIDTGAIARSLAPLALQNALHRSPSEISALSAVPVTVKTLNAKFANASDAMAARGIAYALLLFLYMLILINSQLVGTSVAEEKTSRIAESLIAAIDPAALLAGKIISSTAIALLQMAAWIAAIVASSAVAASALGSPGGSDAAAASSSTMLFSLSGIGTFITPEIAVAFFLFLLIGLLQVSTVYAGFASLINTTEDMSNVARPFLIVVVAAFFIAFTALGVPNAPFVVISSFVPFLAPFVMFSRIAVANVPLWQVGLSLAINLIALYAIAIGAGKVYRVGMLMYGRPPKLAQVLNVLRS